MPVITNYASGTPTVGGATTWSSNTNAVGSASGSYARWRNATANATGYMNLSGYNFAVAIPDGATINSVTFTIKHYNSNTTNALAPQAQAYSGGVALGTLTTLNNVTTTTNTQTVTLGTAPTLAQLRSTDFTVRFTARHANTGTSADTFLDYIGVTVDYAEAPKPKADTLSFTTWATGSTSFTNFDANRRVTGDTLTIDALTTYPSVLSVNRYDLTASQFSIELVTPPNVDNGSTSAGIQVISSSGNRVYLNWGNGAIALEVQVAGAPTYHGFHGYNPALHKYLRVREAGGTLYGEASGDGTTWSVIHSLAVPWQVSSVQHAVLAGNWNQAVTPGSAVFGAVNSYAAPPPPMTWGPNTTIDFSAATVTSPPTVAEVDEVTTLATRAPKHLLWYAALGTGGIPAAGLTAVHTQGKINYLTWEFTDHATPANYTYAAILAGNHNAAIDRDAATIKAFGHTVYLRPFHEMNGTWYPWAIGTNGNTTQQHKDAWAYVRDRFAAAGVTNVRWVWSPNIVFNTVTMESVYPGDASVDVVAVDGYNFGVDPVEGGTWQSPGQVFDPTLDQLRGVVTGRPYWIGETSSSEVGGDKAAWVTEFFMWLTNQPEMDQFTWFHLNKERDWRINSSTGSLTSFQDGISRLTPNTEEAPASAGPDQTVAPWSTVTLTATGTGTWSQVSGTPVTLGGAGSTRTFTAPASMSQAALVFDYGGDQVTITVTRAPHGIRQADGSVLPIRLTRKQ